MLAAIWRINRKESAMLRKTSLKKDHDNPGEPRGLVSGSGTGEGQTWKHLEDSLDLELQDFLSDWL